MAHERIAAKATLEIPDSLPIGHDFLFEDDGNTLAWSNSAGVIAIPSIISFGFFEYSTTVPESWRSKLFGRFSLRQEAYRHLFSTGNPRPNVPFDPSAGSLRSSPDPYG